MFILISLQMVTLIMYWGWGGLQVPWCLFHGWEIDRWRTVANQAPRLLVSLHFYPHQCEQTMGSDLKTRLRILAEKPEKNVNFASAVAWWQDDEDSDVWLHSCGDVTDQIWGSFQVSKQNDRDVFPERTFVLSLSGFCDSLNNSG